VRPYFGNALDLGAKKTLPSGLKMPITELFEDKKRMHFGKLSHVYSVKHLRWPDTTPVSLLLPQHFSLDCSALS
jgi:hypothetical protein